MRWFRWFRDCLVALPAILEELRGIRHELRQANAYLQEMSGTTIEI